ncbi:DUF971 domain-containing protein [Calycomorphotria hydatis]|uniref:Gamma-butyrobetaine hydroxylase-like N-terminal domain-containing protein n=1 Tax=Calycomorphotria hydatis TaxID=2528027 RepID=A0A517TCJ1_9PLAN|nr:DUF971 domain-containing protein [Calycomorphotria hydatis]QDT66097.1 hypothetical protein V22_33610 [Calycomorphotria hydatis]
MSASPIDIRALRDESRFEFVWPGGETTTLPFRFLRGRCPCANCVSENTGERLVGPEDVPADIAPVSLDTAGNYALKIGWSDNHDTGLFTWTYLKQLAHEHSQNQ